ncbi:MAG: hypothetical protein K0Q49_1093 [Haloplasmataceae bacterium]|jgi:5-methylcytosine-specific restriction endonuclease McrBC GTP-binding regulatory subunit McrB|nr:hypothetical protein [Haloplasmataceae bacterium]
MSSSIDEFKAFAKKYPKLRYEVRDRKRTWQSIYEEWSILGDDGSWDNYKEESKESAKTESTESSEFLKTALNYVKKVNPDDITKMIGTVSKVAGIISAFNGGSKNQSQIAGPQRRRVDPLFRRFDDYDD